MRDDRSPLLLIEDDPRDAALIRHMLGSDCSIEWVDRLSGGLDVIRRTQVGEVLLDLNLPDSSGVEGLTKLRRAAPDAAIVVVSGQDDPLVIDQALRYGAVDYLIKGELNPQLLSRVIRFARERQAARAQMEASEERFRRVVEAVQEGLGVHDENGVITFVNEGIARMLGVTPQELIGKNIFEVAPPEMREAMHASLRRRRRTGAPDRYVVDFKRRDGELTRLRISAAPLTDAEGNYAGSVGTVVDLGEENARAEAEEHFRLMVENALVGVFTTVGGVFKYVNPLLCSMLGYSSEDLLGRDYTSIVHPEDHELVAPGVCIRPVLVRVLRGDGTVGMLQIQAVPTTMSGWPAMVGTARDITDHTHDLDWKNHLAAAVESSDDAILTADRNGLILTWNRGAERIFGYSREEMIGRRTVRDLTPPDRMHEIAQALEVIRRGESVEHFETRRLTRKGDLVDVSVTMSPIRDEFGVVALAAIVRDVTAQKRAERQLEQANRISSLGRLAADIAHEFNNVLMGIQPFAEVIERASSEEKVRKAAAQIRSSVNRGKSIVADILRPTRPEPPVLESLELRPWLDQVMRPELTAVLTDSVELAIRVDPPDLRVRANSRQLAQVFVNLTMNAKHAMPDGGRLSISVRHCVASDRYRSGVIPDIARFAEIRFNDNGVGMDARTLDRIFEPLFTTKRAGTGLGLPLAHQIVQRHGGHMFVESSPGSGTTVYIFLPLAEDPASGAKARECATVPRILIVEDEAQVALGIRDLLSLEGFDTLIVEDGRSVPDAVASFHPDVVLLDVSLPDISGFEVQAMLSERWPDLPVIFSTGHATEKDLAGLPRSRFVSLLRKPYDFARLIAEVSRALAS